MVYLTSFQIDNNSSYSACHVRSEPSSVLAIDDSSIEYESWCSFLHSVAQENTIVVANRLVTLIP